MKRYSEAVEDLSKALEIKPERKWALRKIGKLLVSNLGRRSDAVPHLQRLTEIEPENASNWRVYGDVLFDLDDPAAKSIFARYLEVADPNDPEEQEWFPKIRAYVERGEVPVPESP